VGGVERVGDLRDQPRRDRRLQPPAFEQRGEVRALDVLHRHVQAPVLGARAEDAHDVRVADRDLRLVLALEADSELAILAELGRDDLQRDVVAVSARAIDDAHRAATRDPDDFMIRESGTDRELFHRQCRSYHSRMGARNDRPMSSHAARRLRGHER
jgi:hypothetical protein